MNARPFHAIVARNAKALAFWLALSSVLAGTPALAQSPPDEAVAPEMRLAGDRIAIPFTMVREFPFVQGMVNGVSGKFLLDTGAREALALNHHRIPMQGGQPIGSSYFGSGQTYEMVLHALVGPVAVGPLLFPKVTTVTSQDATQLEHITPDFLGWFGHDAWRGYALKLDYKAGVATFYKQGPDDFLSGEKVLAAIPYEVRKLDNNPILFVRVGGVEFQTVLDTGQYGTVFTDAATRDRLESDGWLRRSTSDPETFDLTGIQLPGGLQVAVPTIAVHQGDFPAARGLGLESHNILSLGYGLLQQYKTVWDFPNRKIYILQR